MKKWIERLASNKYIRVAVICVIVMILIAFLGFSFLLSVGSMMPAESRSVLIDILVILITIPVIIATLSVSIMGIRIMIYGEEVKHDASYWENSGHEQEDSGDGNRE